MNTNDSPNSESPAIPMIDRVEAVIEGALGVDDQLCESPHRIARAIIAAMREPTEAMILANSDAAGPDDEQTKRDWRAMIDAALAEQPK